MRNTTIPLAMFALLACGFVACSSDDASGTSAASTGTGTAATSSSGAGGATGSGGSAGSTGTTGTTTGAGGATTGAGGSGSGGGPLCPMPPAEGALGSPCNDMAACNDGLTCADELSMVGGQPLTLGGVFAIPSGTPDPAHPGEYIAGAPSTVPVVFAPNGQCSTTCDPTSGTATCGDCGACSTKLGGSPAFASISIDTQPFSGLSLPPPDPSQTGICRARCTFDAATNGGCPSGYTCDPQSSICVEACLSDAQCNVRFGVSRSTGLVAAVEPGTPYSCNGTTGRCDWTAPAQAKWGAPCERDADCPADVGSCAKGHCITFECAQHGPGADSPHPCPAGALCVGTNPGSVCLGLCNTADDCLDAQGCLAQAGLPNGYTGLCFPACFGDADCGTKSRCDLHGAAAGTCAAYCDPQGVDPNAIACGAGETCAPVDGQTYGFCRKLDQLCFSNDDCWGGQACRVDGADFDGRCVAGCQQDGDCGAGESCVVANGATYGVCRAPGGPCAPPPAGIDQPLRGDAQCVPVEVCSATMPNELGACVAP